jgi:hypothetical protein
LEVVHELKREFVMTMTMPPPESETGNGVARHFADPCTEDEDGGDGCQESIASESNMGGHLIALEVLVCSSSSWP